jgi:hypothetical protein
MAPAAVVPDDEHPTAQDLGPRRLIRLRAGRGRCDTGPKGRGGNHQDDDESGERVDQDR